MLKVLLVTCCLLCASSLAFDVQRMPTNLDWFQAPNNLESDCLAFAGGDQLGSSDEAYNDDQEVLVILKDYDNALNGNEQVAGVVFVVEEDETTTEGSGMEDETTEASQDYEGSGDATEEEVTDGATEMVTEAVTDTTEMVTDTTEMVTDTTEMVTDTTEMVTESVTEQETTTDAAAVVDYDTAVATGGGTTEEAASTTEVTSTPMWQAVDDTTTTQLTPADTQMLDIHRRPRINMLQANQEQQEELDDICKFALEGSTRCICHRRSWNAQNDVSTPYKLLCGVCRMRIHFMQQQQMVQPQEIDYVQY